ncbi:MAG: RusA family crossover junction endodeoxyribonuclease [Oscillospiraceae bacterium]|nr:RusA family crossover junction endodeoxyribonuclease [Oscillospiraceae bacterium]
MHISEINFADIDEIYFVIPFAPVTKKNHGRIVMCGRYPKLLPSKAYERYEKTAIPFLKTNFGMCGTIDYPVNLKCVFYLDKRRKGDLVGYLQAIQDVLVEAGILEDDNRNIVASVDGSAVMYDKANPRTEITITKKSDYEQWTSPNKKR